MLKKMGWHQPVVGALYISLQSLFWLNVLYFIYLRIEAPILAQGAIFWLVITVWMMLLPLPKLSTFQRNIWFIVTFIAGTISGYLLFDDMVTVIMLLVGVSFFSLKKLIDGIDAKQFITSFMSIMLVFSIFFLISYFIVIDHAEISRLIKFLILAFLITITGMLLTQLSHQDGYETSRGFFKQWGIYIGWIWLAILLIALGSVGVMLALSVIYPLAVWLFKMLLTPFVLFVTEVILPWLQNGFNNMLENQQETEKIGPSLEGYLIAEMNKDGMSPIMTLIWNIIVTILVFAVVAFIAYKFYKYVRKTIANRNSAETDTDPRDDKIIVQRLHAIQDDRSWVDKMRGIFRPYSDREEHLIRKQYRQMLKLLRKKGLWKNDTMTVHQLNQLIHADHSSTLYERLRYGDQDLSDEEVELYREEIQKIIGKIKK